MFVERFWFGSYQEWTVWAENSFGDAQLTGQIFAQGTEGSQTSKIKESDMMYVSDELMFVLERNICIYIYI